MSRREEYEKRAEELLAPIVELNGFELVDVEYVKEAGNWYLRGYIDKPGGITVNDCETVSRAFSDKLDENDFIEDSYIMEISSPGLDRPLKKDKDFERNMGKLVEIRTYRPIEKQKEFCGILTAYDSNSVTIDEDGTERVFDKKDTASCRIQKPYRIQCILCFSAMKLYTAIVCCYCSITFYCLSKSFLCRMFYTFIGTFNTLFSSYVILICQISCKISSLKIHRT